MQLLIFHFVDFAHPATGNEANHSIAFADDLVGREDRLRGLRLSLSVILPKSGGKQEIFVSGLVAWLHNRESENPQSLVFVSRKPTVAHNS